MPVKKKFPIFLLIKIGSTWRFGKTNIIRESRIAAITADCKSVSSTVGFVGASPTSPTRPVYATAISRSK